jgi:hypothetical protein
MNQDNIPAKFPQPKKKHKQKIETASGIASTLVA